MSNQDDFNEAIKLALEEKYLQKKGHNVPILMEGETVMKIKTALFLSVIALFIVISGCQNNENVEKVNIPEKVEAEVQEKEPTDDLSDQNDSSEMAVEAPLLPTSLGELEQLVPGFTEYISTVDPGSRKVLDEMTADLPDISGESTTEELDRFYEALLSIFQHDFIGPGELIQDFKLQSMGSPDVEDPRYQFKDSLNVMVILDASGSMANFEGNKTRMEAAKEAINNFVQGLPENANVGLRIYGHEGTGDSSDKARSCSSSELIYPIGKYDGTKFNEALEKAKPAGWTPIGLALNEAQKDLSSYKGDANTNIIYLVSDGISTCDDDPFGAAKALYNSDITPIVNVIGFNVDHEGQKQLQEVAKAADGSYQNVTNTQGLLDQLNKAAEVAEKWEQWKEHQGDWLDVYKVQNGLEIFAYHALESQKVGLESRQISSVITYLFQHKKIMSEESHDYLIDKNKEYHSWIEHEYAKLKKDLEALNEANYAEAVKTLEEKYLQNTTTP